MTLSKSTDRKHLPKLSHSADHSSPFDAAIQQSTDKAIQDGHITLYPAPIQDNPPTAIVSYTDSLTLDDAVHLFMWCKEMHARGYRVVLEKESKDE